MSVKNNFNINSDNRRTKKNRGGFKIPNLPNPFSKKQPSSSTTETVNNPKISIIYEPDTMGILNNTKITIENDTFPITN
jgi:hypothetical protein